MSTSTTNAVHNLFNLCIKHIIFAFQYKYCQDINIFITSITITFLQQDIDVTLSIITNFAMLATTIVYVLYL